MRSNKMLSALGILALAAASCGSGTEIDVSNAEVDSATADDVAEVVVEGATGPTNGMATAQVGELVLEHAGECEEKDDGRRFFASERREIVANIASFGEDVEVSVSVVDYSDIENAAEWIAVRSQYAAEETADGYTISGIFSNGLSPDAPKSEGVITVSCP